MRVKIIVEPIDPFIIRVGYNSAIQGFIYHNLSVKLADKIHDMGFLHEKRTFKMFTFSRLYGVNKPLFYDRSNGTLKTDLPFWFILSSPVHDLIREFSSAMAAEEILNIGGCRVAVSEIDVIKQPVFSDNAAIKMLSPVTVYSTLLKASGDKKTYYYHPDEPEFNDLCLKNLLKKFSAFFPDKQPLREELSQSPFKIEPLSHGFAPRQEIIKYKGFVIKGYMGVYRIQAHPLLLELAYDSGLGAKNSQGFGCFELFNSEKTK